MAAIKSRGAAALAVALTTVNSQARARTLAKSLITARVAACVTIIAGVESHYRWKGKVHRDKEWLLVMKTPRTKVKKLKTVLLAIHPYDVPEFVVLTSAAVHGAYLHWALKETL